MQSLGGMLVGRTGGRRQHDLPDASDQTPEADASDSDPGIALTCSARWQGRSQKFGCRTRLRSRLFRIDPTERAWQIAASLFIGAVVLYGLQLGGHVDRTMALVFDGTASAAVKAGFTVQRLTIEGQRRASDREIVRALQVGPGVSMLSFDTAAAQKRLERLPWVRQAKVMRLLPSSLRIVIDEREPFAVWQIKGEMRLVDMDGTVIAPLASRDSARLPLVVGEGAGEHAAGLLDSLESHSDLKQRLVAAVRVADRRWNLKLKSGIEVRLPEKDAAGALDRLAELDESRGVLSSAVVAIDLRLADRITLRLTREAAAELDLALTGASRAGADAGRDT